MVTSAGERYAIPQVSLLELVGLDGEQARKGVEMIHGVPVYRLRGRLLPLVYLKQVLKTGPPESAVADDAPTLPEGGFERVNIVVLQADGRSLAWWSTKFPTPRKSSSSPSAAT